METGEGLVRMPAGDSPEQQMDFLLDRQDPSTGAFMDARYPYFTYFGPTENVIEALEQLARRTGRPLQLKYPLRFLDRIREPAQLRAHLDSLLYLKEPWASIAAGPGPYGAGVSELAFLERLEDLGLFGFSAEWKAALRRWFLDTQDPATGFWGHRIGTPGRWRQREDVNSTFHVLKLFARGEAGGIRHAAALARNLAGTLDRPVPSDTAAQHTWSLEQAQGARLMAWLWEHLLVHEQDQAREAMARALALRYKHFFRQEDGGFSLYAGAAASDPDGTANALALLRGTGSLPGTRERERLWGRAIAAGPTVERIEVGAWEQAAIPAGKSANSLRVYAGAAPAGDGYEDANLAGIVAAGGSGVRDVMEVRQQVARFLAAGGPSFGNWASKESLRDQPLGLQPKVKAVPVSHEGLDLARLIREHPGVRRFIVVGCDVFQVPVFRLEYVLKGSRRAQNG
jgi:hypothetical protein